MFVRLPFLSILVFLILLTSCQTAGISMYSRQPQEEYTEVTSQVALATDPAMNLLGRSLDDITQLLGDPDERGYDDWRGPHYHITYRQEEGIMRIFFPEQIENRFADSIVLGPGQQVLGARVGMPFEEIEALLGSPDYGPERGMDDLYYMDYYFGNLLDGGMPEVFVSFSARSPDSPTDEAFIKQEIRDSPVLESNLRAEPGQ